MTIRKAISLLLTVSILAVCVACQPTPEEEYVPQRDSKGIEEKLEAGNPASLEQTPEPESAVSYKEYVEAYKASLPQRWEEEMAPFHFDGDVIVNNENSFPVYTITRIDFDMEQLESIANNFFKDVTGMRTGYKPTAEEYVSALASLKERGMTEYAEYVYKEMQEGVGGEYTETDHITLSDKGYQRYIVRLADGAFGCIYIARASVEEPFMFYESCLDGMVYLAKGGEMDGSYVDEGTVIVEPLITQEQGQEMVNAFLAENGLKGFTVAAITPARHFDILYRQEISQGWQFTLMRTFEYYSIDTSDPLEGSGWLEFGDDMDYSQPWRREVINIYVSENGIEYFAWNYPMEVTGIVAENVELLDFEQIQNNIRKLLLAGVTSGWQGEVTQIALTVSAQQVKDDPKTAYLMPVWVVYIDWYDDYNYSHKRISDSSQYNLFGVNALDGSRAYMHGEW